MCGTWHGLPWIHFVWVIPYFCATDRSFLFYSSTVNVSPYSSTSIILSHSSEINCTFNSAKNRKNIHERIWTIAHHESQHIHSNFEPTIPCGVCSLIAVDIRYWVCAMSQYEACFAAGMIVVSHSLCAWINKQTCSDILFSIINFGMDEKRRNMWKITTNGKRNS